MSSTTLSITLPNIIVQPKFTVVTLSDNLRHTILLGGTLQSGELNTTAYNIYKNTSGTWTINSYTGRLDASLGTISDIIAIPLSSGNKTLRLLYSASNYIYTTFVTPTSINIVDKMSNNITTTDKLKI